jgi:hypothetical protein
MWVWIFVFNFIRWACKSNWVADLFLAYWVELRPAELARRFRRFGNYINGLH